MIRKKKMLMGLSLWMLLISPVFLYAMGKSPERDGMEEKTEKAVFSEAEFENDHKTKRHAEPDVREMQIEKGLIDPDKS